MSLQRLIACVAPVRIYCFILKYFQPFSYRRIIVLRHFCMLFFNTQGIKIGGLPQTFTPADLLSVYTPVGNGILAASPTNTVATGLLDLAAPLATLPTPVTVQTADPTSAVEFTGVFPTIPTDAQLKALLPAGVDPTTVTVTKSPTVSTGLQLFYFIFSGLYPFSHLVHRP